MAKVPTGQERVVFSGASIPGGTGVSRGGTVLGQALQRWSAQQKEKRDVEALERVTDFATQAQQAANAGANAAGTTVLAEAPENTTGVFREAFEAQAKTVFAANLTRNANREVRKLADEYKDDPGAFAGAWNAYMVGQIKPLQEADPSGALEVQNQLDALGQKVMFDLEDRASAEAREAQAVQFSQDLSTSIAETQDALLNDPTETAFADAIETHEALIVAGREQGLLTAAGALQAEAQMREQFAAEFARGRFNVAVEAGDIGGAMGVIKQLDAGGLFDDNDDARRVAASLRQELAARTQEASAVSQDQIQIAGRTANALQAIVQQGGSVNQADVEQVAGTLMLGDEANQDQAVRFVTGVEMQQRLRSHGTRMTLGQLAQFRSQLGSAAAVLSSEDLNSAFSFIDQRTQQISDAMDRDDYLAVVPGLTLESTPQQIQRARIHASQVTQVPLDQIPLRTHAMVEQARSQFRDALAGQQYEQASQIMAEYLAPARGNPVQEVALAMQAAEPEFGAWATMTAVAGPELASELFALSVAGRGVDNPTLEQEARDSAPTDFFAAADALSMGSPGVRDAALEQLLNAWTGFYAEGRNRNVSDGRLKRDFSTLIEAVAQTEELSNGARIPLPLFGGARVSDPVLDEINRVLGDDAAEFFGPNVADNDAILQSIRPVPGPDGQMFFQSTRRNGLMMDPNNPNELLRLDPSRAIQQEVGDVGDMTPQVQGASEAAVRRSRTLSIQRNEIPLAASVTQGSERLLSAIHKAAQFVPRIERVGRQVDFMFSEDNLADLDMGAYRAAWGRLLNARAKTDPTLKARLDRGFRPEPPDPLREPEGAALAASILLTTLGKQFDDPEQVAAAYWLGVDAVEALGDDWRDTVPAEVHQFIGRLEQQL